MLNRGFFAACVLLAVLPATLGRTVLAEEIHQCKDENGEIVYQDDPCPPPAPAKPAAKTSSKSQPKSAAKAEPAAKPSKKPKTEKAASTPAPAPAPQKNWVVVPSAVQRRVPPAPTGRFSDGRLATPEKTLETFVAAVKSGDRDGVLSCLTSSALADWGPDPPELPMDKLQKTVDSFTGFVPEGDLGPFWSIRAQRGGKRPKWIFFERTGSGDWKIAVL